MEAYRTKCPDCGHVRVWTGYKTGLGKSPEQLEQMQKDYTTCVQCGSPRAKTGLDHDSEMGQALDAQTNLLAKALSDFLRERPE